mmetsp:Transcript_32855/g.50225  ORF Transcript_32855/g.50225 Transcript_32855/m.50225 type:complete len:115 (+) Transcript_32855:1719-2063(+)
MEDLGLKTMSKEEQHDLQQTLNAIQLLDQVSSKPGVPFNLAPSMKHEASDSLKRANQDISSKFFEVSSEQQRTRNDKREQINNKTKHKQALELIKQVEDQISKERGDLLAKLKI